MISPRYRVTLTSEERVRLTALTNTTNGQEYIETRPDIAAMRPKPRDGSGWTNPRVVEAVGVSKYTVEALKRRFVEKGPDSARRRKQRQTSLQALNLRRCILCATACAGLFTSTGESYALDDPASCGIGSEAEHRGQRFALDDAGAI